MIRSFNPKSIAPPAAAYTHSFEIPPNARWLVVSGQIGVKPDGTVPSTVEEQAEAVWNNIAANLAEAGMGMTDIVKITSYVTKPEHFAKVTPVRAKHLAGHRPASTSLCIAALARPEFLLEVEVIAAKV